MVELTLDLTAYPGLKERVSALVEKARERSPGIRRNTVLQDLILEGLASADWPRAQECRHSLEKRIARRQARTGAAA